MDGAALVLALFVACAGAAGVWLLTRFACMRLSRHEGEAAVAQQTWFAVHWRRMSGLVLCVGALAAWANGLAWPLCFGLAAAGCWLQCLAYRLRRDFALGTSRKRQEEALKAANAGPADV